MTQEFKNNIISAFAAVTAVAGIGVATLSADVQAQEPIQVSTTTPNMQQAGKPVTLRLGRGFSLSAADGIASVLESHGCKTTVENAGGSYKAVEVDTNGKKFNFRSIGSATSTALDWCLGRS